MRTNIFGTIFIAAALAIAAISCQKSMDESGPTAGNDGTIDIKVNAAMGQYSPAEATKAERVAVTRVSWKGDETVYVYDGKQCLGSLTAALAGTEDRYALLSTDATHTVAKPADGTTKLTLLYSPLFTEAPAITKKGAISISLARQIDAAPPFVIYATLDYDGAETVTIINTVVPFKLATSLITVNCAGLEPGKAIKCAKLTNVNTVCKLTLSGTDVPAISGDVNGTISRAGDAHLVAGNANSDGSAIFQIATPLLETASEARVLTVAQGALDLKDKNFSKKSLAVATAVNTFFHIGEKSAHLIGVFSVSDTKKVYFSPGNLQATYHKSTTNYTWDFAENQYDVIGNAPGNTTIDTQTDSAVVDLFGWSTKNTTYGISTSNMPSSFSGSFKDWGIGYCNCKGITPETTWYTLTIGEWKYLLNNHSGRWSSVNGVNGFVVAPDNFTGVLAASYSDKGALAAEAILAADDILFLPAAGYRITDDFVPEGSGFYWSSSKDDKDDDKAHYVFFSNGPNTDEKQDRLYGYSVRLVKVQ